MKLERRQVVAHVIAEQIVIAGKRFRAVEADEEIGQGRKPVPFP
jgi:hypothetical protein